jgi:hypothetical protein
MYSFLVCASPETAGHGGKNKNPPENPAGFRKTVLQSTRSKIPPEHNDMPCDALQRGGGKHRLGRFNEHFGGILR